MVVLFLVHTNSAYPRRKHTKSRPPPLVPPRLSPSPSPSAVANRLYICRSKGLFPCFGRKLRCYPQEEKCNNRPYCPYHDDELNCPDSSDRRVFRTFTIRITKTTGPAKMAVSTTTTTTTSTMTSASATSTSTSTATTGLTINVTPTPNIPFSVATAISITTFQRMVTSVTPVVGFVPGPGIICRNFRSVSILISSVPTRVHVITRGNIIFSESLAVVPVCTSTTVAVQ